MSISGIHLTLYRECSERTVGMNAYGTMVSLDLVLDGCCVLFVRGFQLLSYSTACGGLGFRSHARVKVPRFDTRGGDRRANGVWKESIIYYLQCIHA